MIHNVKTGKPRGYAFIEYEHERDMHCEYPAIHCAQPCTETQVNDDVLFLYFLFNHGILLKNGLCFSIGDLTVGLFQLDLTNGNSCLKVEHIITSACGITDVLFIHKLLSPRVFMHRLKSPIMIYISL